MSNDTGARQRARRDHGNVVAIAGKMSVNRHPRRFSVVCVTRSGTAVVFRRCEERREAEVTAAALRRVGCRA